MDPLAPSFPELTPYQFASNSPIYAIDLDGLEAVRNSWSYSLGLGKPYVTFAIINSERYKNANPRLPDGVAVGVVGSGTVKNGNVSIEKSKVLLRLSWYAFSCGVRVFAP